MALIGPMKYLTIGDKTYEIEASGGSVTSVGLDNATGESDFTISGSPITSSGTITIEHSNSTTAKSTQAVYPITFDKHGHITGSGNAVTIPSVTTWYGTSSTTASTAEKAVTCSGFTLVAGDVIAVLFSTANTAATPTLNVNSTGAKSIYIGASTPNSTTNVLKWSANTLVYFVYDGTYFRYITSISAATVEPSRGANTWYGTSGTTATTQAKTSTINNFVLVKGALVSINFTYANTYTSAKITLNINSTGAKDVYYNGTVTSSTNTLLWNAGEVLTFMYDGTGYQYIGKSVQKISQLTNDSGYTSNTGTVTSVGISNATNGGLSISGSPVTGSGSITVGHSNVLTNAQTTQAVYPIAIDKNGHVSSYGTAVTVPTASDTYSSTSSNVMTGKGVNAALQTLDSSITATTGEAISAITITDGKISASSKVAVGDANQNAFSNVKVGTTTIAADTTTDTLELTAGTDITLTPDATNDKVTIAFSNASGYTKNTGTVTSVGISNTTNGGLSVSGSPVTGSGTISVGHSNVLTSAQTTQAVYPIAIDKNGHISSYGTAVAIPNNSNWVNGSAAGSLRTINASSTIGTGAVAEGIDSEASGDYSHAEGYSTASEDFSHSEGESTEANAEAAHAEGYLTEASGVASHAEGDGTVASGYGSHTEGSNTNASGIDAHAEGGSTTASGSYAHAEGCDTTANHKSQHVFGEYNVLDDSIDPNTARGTYVEIVGKGTSNSARSNARTLDWSGNETLAGKLTLGAAPTANMDAATKQYVDSAKTVVTLNGTTTSNASFYAPTSAGTSNYFLKSSGSGAPSWSQPIKYGTSLPASGDFTGQVFILIE